MTAPAPSPNYSYFLPPCFTSLTNVEDFLTHFEAVCTLSNWVALTPDPCPNLFSARLDGYALNFYRSLTTAQKVDDDELKRLFRQQKRRTAKFWRPKWSPSGNYPAKMCPLSTGHSVFLQKKAYSDDAVRSELLFTTFSEGMANFQFCRSVGSTKNNTNSGQGVT